MKNNMKKIIISVFSFVLLFMGQSVFAATNNVSWNTLPGDCPGSGIANYNTGAGAPPPGSNDCWNLTSVSGNSGDSINVQLYYHNTGNEPATNTRVYIHVSPSLGTPSTTHTFTSSLTASPTGTPLGTTTLHLNTAQSLSIGSQDTWWYPNQSTTNPIKSGAEITTSSGLYLGTINNGWTAQGAVVSSFKVGSTQAQNCTIDSFSANYTNITPGQPSTLSWQTDNCTSASISPSVGNVNVNGTYVVHPTQTTTYTLTATGSNGVSDTSTVTVNVNAVYNSCVINNFIATPPTINQGGSSSLGWYTSDCAYVKLYNGTTLIDTYHGMSGNQAVTPTQTTTYTLKGYSTNGSNTSTKTVKVTVNQIAQSCVIDEFYASQATINSGGFSTLHWTTIGCSNVTISNLNYNVPLSGQQDVWPTSTTTYVLTAYSSNGQTQTRSVTVTVNQITQGCTIKDFTASPMSISSGGSSVLDWETTGCVSASISDSVRSHNVSVSGTETVRPTRTTTYTLTARSSSGVVKTRSVTVTVNQITQGCTIKDFTASPMSISSGGSSVLDWETTGCVSATISDSVRAHNVSLSGSEIVRPTRTTTYTLTARSSSGVVKTRSVTVSVITISPLCVINRFTASPDIITSGQSSTLSWRTSGCTDVSISNLNYNIPTTGSQEVWPTRTTTYTLTATGSNSPTQTRSVTVTVRPISQVCTINSFSANPNVINSGESSVLSWSTSGCESVALNGTEVPAYGSQTVSPTHGTATYTLTGKNSYGIVQTRTVTITVNSNPQTCTINNFTASPTDLNSAGNSTLSWNTTNCTNVTISNLGYSVPTSGSQSVWVSQTTTYTLTATNSYGATQTQSVTIYVGNNNNNCRIIDFSASDTSIDEGDSTILRWETDDCERVRITEIGNVPNTGNDRVYPDSDTTYVLTAYDFDGSTITDSLRINVDEDNNNNDNDCRINSFTADQTYIDRGDEVELRWRTTACDDVSISNFGDVDEDGSETFSPNNTTTYTLRARGDNGSDSESIRITVGGGGSFYNTNVVTTIATNITQTSAQVNGLITSTNYGNATTYFEYGTNVNLGMRTSSRPTGGNSYFNEYLSNLSPNTIYFFRAVGEGSNGVSRGAIEVFRTAGYNNNWNNNNTNTTNTNTRIIRETVVEQGNTVYGSLSPIMLRIENRYQTIGVGDVIDYTVYYKNISISRLTNPMVQVYVPKGVIITNSSRGTFSNESRTLSVPIADLNPNDEGVIYLQAVVEELDANLAQIVTTAVLIYTNPNGAQENAMAYVLNNPKVLNGNNLGASAFFFGNILGLSLIGWLLLIILIMLLILLSRSYYGRRNVITTTTTERTTHQ